MKKTINIILAVFLISYIVYMGSVIYYGTFDLLSLGFVERQMIAKIWIVSVLIWYFLIKED